MKMSTAEKADLERVRGILGQIDTSKLRESLELGCGTGAVSAMVAENYGLIARGTDRDPAQIALAKQTYPEHDRLQFSVEDVAHLSFPDDSFDLIIAQDIFHNVSNWYGAVYESARVLRPHGYFICSDRSCPPRLKPLLRLIARKSGVYTIDDLRLAFDRHGLETRSYSVVAQGLFPYHEFVLQKIPIEHGARDPARNLSYGLKKDAIH